MLGEENKQKRNKVSAEGTPGESKIKKGMEKKTAETRIFKEMMKAIKEMKMNQKRLRKK